MSSADAGEICWGVLGTSLKHTGINIPLQKSWFHLFQRYNCPCFLNLQQSNSLFFAVFCNCTVMVSHNKHFDSKLPFRLCNVFCVQITAIDPERKSEMTMTNHQGMTTFRTSSAVDQIQKLCNWCKWNLDALCIFEPFRLRKCNILFNWCPYSNARMWFHTGVAEWWQWGTMTDDNMWQRCRFYTVEGGMTLSKSSSVINGDGAIDKEILPTWRGNPRLIKCPLPHFITL